MTYTRKCPECNGGIDYSSLKAMKRASIANSGCRKCKCGGFGGKQHSTESKALISKSVKLNPHPTTGKHWELSNDTKLRQSNGAKLSWCNPTIRQKRLSVNRWNNKSCDRGQLELINKWNRLGFRFEPNYQLKTKTDLFYIDGFDKEHGVILEYDSKYHTNPKQQRADLIRQNRIIEILKPNVFWRYNAVTNKVGAVYRQTTL